MTTTEEAPIRFITSVYGKKYGGMLLPLLYSIKTSHPAAHVSVFWDDINETTRLLERAFPDYEFVASRINATGDVVNRIAEKASLWAYAARRYPGENLVLLDSDMLVIRDITNYFQLGFDIGFTYKDETYPINTGILLVRESNESSQTFLDAWATRTVAINSNSEEKRMATNRSFPYGAPDQMAFYELVGFSLNKDQYAVQINDGYPLIFRAIPCGELNETNSCPITDTTRVIHYKGGWHPILLDGTGFTSHRPKADSWEMYLLYLATYNEAMRYVKTLLGLSRDRFFGIKRPFYIDADLKESKPLYSIFQVREHISRPLRELFFRIARTMKNREVKRRQTLPVHPL